MVGGSVRGWIGGLGIRGSVGLASFLRVVGRSRERSYEALRSIGYSHWDDKMSERSKASDWSFLPKAFTGLELQQRCAGMWDSTNVPS